MARLADEHGDDVLGRTGMSKMASVMHMDAADQQQAARGPGKHRGITGDAVLPGNDDGQRCCIEPEQDEGKEDAMVNKYITRKPCKGSVRPEVHRSGRN